MFVAVTCLLLPESAMSHSDKTLYTVEDKSQSGSGLALALFGFVSPNGVLLPETLPDVTLE